MRSITVNYNLANTGTISGNTITGGTPLLLNSNNSVVGIGFSCEVTGTINYTVYHCYDDASNPAITPTWFSHGIPNMVNATSTQESNFVVPVSAAQVIINSGTGSVKFVVLQQGII